MPVLTGIDVLGIQRYVFASNRLRNVLAASWMVDYVTRRESDSLLQWGITDDRVLLAAGGNAILRFDSEGDARAWTTRFTRWLYDKAPGLDVAIAHLPYDGRPLAWALKALAIKLARTKLDRRPSAPQLGLSVTATCVVTGLPATSLDEHDENPIARHIAMLRNEWIRSSAKERWDIYLPSRLEHASEWAAEFPDELDDMGRSRGDTSLLGVVHVDGNGVGLAIQKWLERCLDDGVDDERVCTEYRRWSEAIERLGQQVLKAVVNRVGSCIYPGEQTEQDRCFVRGTPLALGFALKEERTKGRPPGVLLPLRPILLGGDDLTFVCDGRIALDLAVAALREFKNHRIPHLGEKGGERMFTASAGVAMVKAHAPFHRSYELAESLCSNAKRKRQEAGSDDASWLDWHIGLTRPGDRIDAIRDREYQHGKLTMRPYPLTRFDGREQTWDWLDTELLGPGREKNTAERGLRGDKHWAESRSRVKRLGALVAEEPEAIKRQLDGWNAIEPGVALPAGLNSSGFIGERTPLLDAIELLDLHMRLESSPKGE